MSAEPDRERPGLGLGPEDDDLPFRCSRMPRLEEDAGGAAELLSSNSNGVGYENPGMILTRLDLQCTKEKVLPTRGFLPNAKRQNSPLEK